MVPAYQDETVTIYVCDHAALAGHLAGSGVDALATDAPYSKRTHTGHDGGAAQANGEDRAWTRSNGRVERKRKRKRRDLDYASWTHADVEAFVDAWAPIVRGWIVSLTDSDLAIDWRSSYEANGRLGFQPLPCVETGATVRLCGGGPSSWATYALVSRPRSEPWSKWPTLPGAYTGPAEEKPWVGGKPLWLMLALLRDYTREGDLVCDPCMGAGTTAIAAMRLGRRFVGCDVDVAAVEATVARVRAERERAEAAGRQVALWQPPCRARRAKQVGLALDVGPEDFRGSDDPTVAPDIREHASMDPTESFG